MGNLRCGRNRVQRSEPEIYGTINAFAIVGGAVIKHESTESGEDDSREGARFLFLMTPTDQGFRNKLEPVFHPGLEKTAELTRMALRQGEYLKGKLERRLRLRVTHLAPDRATGVGGLFVFRFPHYAESSTLHLTQA